MNKQHLNSPSPLLLSLPQIFLRDAGIETRPVMRGFSPADLLAGLCHTEDQNPFPLLQDGRVSPCFNQLVLGALPHAIMAISCAGYLSMSR